MCHEACIRTFVSASRHTCWPCGFVMKIEVVLRCFCSSMSSPGIRCYDGSKRNVSARKSEEENALFCAIFQYF